MISLEQVQLLETRVVQAIEYVERVTAENATLISEKAGLLTKLEANQKRIDELEVLVMRFKDDQGRIEDGIISALDRLNQFEEAIEKSLKEKQAGASSGEASRSKPAVKSASPARTPVKPKEPQMPEAKEVFFEIPEKETGEDADPPDGDSSADGELDIF
jgi:predicted nuclease with TOPRIM domain